MLVFGHAHLTLGRRLLAFDQPERAFRVALDARHRAAATRAIGRFLDRLVADDENILAVLAQCRGAVDPGAMAVIVLQFFRSEERGEGIECGSRCSCGGWWCL